MSKFTDGQLGLIGVVGGIATFALVICIALSSVAPSDAPVLNLPASARSVINGVVPQGWQFFTKDPQSAEILPFHKVGSTWVSIQLQGGLHWDTLFGLDRVNREQGIEIGVISSLIPTNAWLPCSVSPMKCLSVIPIEAQVTDSQPHPTLCGDIGLANQAPVPWAWARLNPVPIMPSDVVRVDVLCTT